MRKREKQLSREMKRWRRKTPMTFSTVNERDCKHNAVHVIYLSFGNENICIGAHSVYKIYLKWTDWLKYNPVILWPLPSQLDAVSPMTISQQDISYNPSPIHMIMKFAKSHISALGALTKFIMNSAFITASSLAVLQLHSTSVLNMGFLSGVTLSTSQSARSLF